MRLWIAAIACVVFAALVAFTMTFELGRDAANSKINQQNQEAGDEADRASSVFERCIDGGGVFDFATGQCRGR